MVQLLKGKAGGGVIRSKHSCGQSRNFEVNLDRMWNLKNCKNDKKQGWWKMRMAQLEVFSLCFSKFSLFWVGFYMFGCLHWFQFLSPQMFTNFVITNNSQQKQSTYTQYSSSEISWKANSHDAIPAVHHRACCSKSDRSDAFTAHLRVSYKAPQIIPGAPLLPLYYPISLKISASKLTSLSPILLLPQIP